MYFYYFYSINIFQDIAFLIFTFIQNPTFSKAEITLTGPSHSSVFKEGMFEIMNVGFLKLLTFSIQFHSHLKRNLQLPFLTFFSLLFRCFLDIFSKYSKMPYVSNLLFQYNTDDVANTFPGLSQRLEEDPQTKKFLEELPKNSKNLMIVDAGCGNGQISTHLSMSNPKSKVVAFDCSEQFISVAEKIEPRAANIEFQVMDMLNMDKIPENSVDFMTAIYSLHVKHKDDLAPLFAHIASKLKEGGKLKFLTNTLECKNGKPFPKSVEESRAIPITLNKLETPFDLVDYVCWVDEVKAALSQAGFRCERFDSFDGSDKMADNYEFLDQVTLMETIFDAVLE